LFETGEILYERGLQHLDSWLRGSGCIPIRYLMEGAATAEICHAQIWQCDKHDAP